MSGTAASPLRRLARSLYRIPSPTYNHASHRNLVRFGREVRPQAGDADIRILNLGGGGRPLPPEVGADAGDRTVVNLDLGRHTGVSCIGDAQRLPFASDAFTGVLSTAVLEHLPEPPAAIAEMTRVGQPGALIYVEVPFMQGFHASPDDYQRFTRSGLSHLFRSHDEVNVGVCVGPSSALSWVLRGYVKGLLSGFSRRRQLERLAEFVASWLTVPIKYLDAWVADRPAAEDLASAFYVFARVPRNRDG